MNKNEVGGWLRALAQPTTYLGLAMLAFVFAGLTFLLIQSRADEEDEAKRTEPAKTSSVYSLSRFPGC